LAVLTLFTVLYFICITVQQCGLTIVLLKKHLIVPFLLCPIYSNSVSPDSYDCPFCVLCPVFRHVLGRLGLINKKGTRGLAVRFNVV